MKTGKLLIRVEKNEKKRGFTRFMNLKVAKKQIMARQPASVKTSPFGDY
jgi:hypothetical protein